MNILFWNFKKEHFFIFKLDNYFAQTAFFTKKVDAKNVANYCMYFHGPYEMLLQIISQMSSEHSNMQSGPVVQALCYVTMVNVLKITSHMCCFCTTVPNCMHCMCLHISCKNDMCSSHSEHIL